MKPEDRAANRRAVRWLLVAASLCALVWLGRGSAEPQLATSLVNILELNVESEQSTALWMLEPARHATAIGQELRWGSEPLLGAAGPESQRALRIWRAAKEMLVLAGSGGVSLELRLSPAMAVGLKAVGVATGNPWLRGGRVEANGDSGLVRWRKGGSWVADRWHLSVGNRPLLAKADPDPFPANELNEIVLLRIPAGAVGGEESASLWGLAPIEPGNGLRWRRWEESSTLAAADVDPWWSDRPAVVAGDDLVVGAVQRTGQDWQALAWLSTTVEVSERRVTLELPRAAILGSVGHPDPWLLPAEPVARTLDADFETRSLDGGVRLRSLSPAATEWTQLNSGPLKEWARLLPDGALGAQLRLGDLLDWARAIRRMEQMMGVGDRDGAWSRFRLTDLSQQLERVLNGVDPLLVHWQEPFLVLAR